MTGCVLDASAALAVLVSSQRTAAAEAFFIERTENWLAPDIFRLEVRNVLLKLERRTNLDLASVFADLSRLESSISFPTQFGLTELARVTDLARQTGLGIYDAAYLDRALTSGTAIASRDGSLLMAANNHNLPVFDLR